MSITNPTYDNLAQTAHALAGYGIALTGIECESSLLFWKDMNYSSKWYPIFLSVYWSREALAPVATVRTSPAPSV
jgi:hypothetical protein